MRRKTGLRHSGRAAVAWAALVGSCLVCLSGLTWPLRVLVARRRRWPSVSCRHSQHAHARSLPLTHPTSSHSSGVAPLMSSLSNNLKTPLDTEAAHAMNNNLKTVVDSADYCARRNAMARAAGLAAGLAVATVSNPAYDPADQTAFKRILCTQHHTVHTHTHTCACMSMETFTHSYGCREAAMRAPTHPHTRTPTGTRPTPLWSRWAPTADSSYSSLRSRRSARATPSNGNPPPPL